MKTFEVDIDTMSDIEISKYFKKSNLEKGDEVKLLTTAEDERNISQKIAIILVVALAIIAVITSRKEDFVTKALKNIFDKYETEEELEKELEKELGINIAFVNKKTDPLDETFGLWKNRKTSLESIRKKAWQRTN